MSTKSDTTELQKAIVNESKDPVMLAFYLLGDNPSAVRCNGQIYLFNGKCYDLLDVKDMDKIFLSFVVKYGITQAWRNINLIVRAFWAYPTIPEIAEMNSQEDLICLNNGVLNIKTKEFFPHSPKYYFDSYVDVDYDPKAGNCPVFMKYLQTTFSGDVDTITNIIRIGGYLLDTSCAAEKMFLFDGRGSNGKSLLLNIFSMFFAKDQVTPLSLEQLASTGFNKEILIKSRINICAEQKKGFLDAEEIKKIVSGDLISIDRKYKLTISFNPKTKILANCNGAPTFKDNSHAIYRRMLMVSFNNCYMDECDYVKIKDPESKHIYIKDKKLFSKIREEKSAILNLFIDGLLELREDDYNFISGEALARSMSEFKRDSDTVREFLEDNYEASSGDETTSLREVYNHYRFWYRQNVSDYNSLKFRINEMGKRIRDVLDVESIGQKYVFNSESQRSERETLYPIRLIANIDGVDVEFTEEQAKQQGIDFK